jgi:hypothetical protein
MQIIHLSYYLDEVPPEFNFIFCNKPIWFAHHSKQIETIEAPQIEGSIFKYRAVLDGYHNSHRASAEHQSLNP